jgi:hypothetical protein
MNQRTFAISCGYIGIVEALPFPMPPELRFLHSSKRSEMPAAIAGVIRNVLTTRAKL